MTTENQRSDSTTTIRLTVVLLGLLVLAIILLTPVKGWLNRIPHMWQILNPLLTLLAGYLVLSAVRARESWLTVVKWALLLTGTACASLYFLFDVSPIFFTLGRWGAIAFIALEVVRSLVASLTVGAGPETA